MKIQNVFILMDYILFSWFRFVENILYVYMVHRCDDETWRVNTPKAKFVTILFTHLKVCLASAIYNYEWNPFGNKNRHPPIVSKAQLKPPTGAHDTAYRFMSVSKQGDSCSPNTLLIRTDYAYTIKCVTSK